MKNINSTDIVVFAGTSVLVGIATYTYLKVREIERKKREEIEKNKNLDILAIKRATDRVKKKIWSTDSVHEMVQAYNNLDVEIAFEKIAVREEV